MSTQKQLKSPKSTEQAESLVPVVQKFHGGMLKGDTPLSIIGTKNVNRYINAIGYGPWAEGRPGTRLYSKAQLPEETFVADDVTDVLTTYNRFVTGDRIKFRSSGTLPSPITENTVYYVIYLTIDTMTIAVSLENAIAAVRVDITDIGIGTHYMRYAGNIRVSLDHKKEKKIVKQYGRRIYVAEKNLESYIEVVNTETVEPSDTISGLEESGGAAILASGPVFRIVLDEDFYYMYRISCPVPVDLLEGIIETVLLIYGYRYVYSFGKINSTGTRNRLTTGAELVLETGTCKDPAQEIYYSEIFFDTAVGADLTEDHVIGDFILPPNNQSISHYPLYRTKNLGETTGGAGNNSVYFVWDEDIPVAKAIRVTVAGDVATIVAGQNGFVRGDVGCTLRAAAAGVRTAVIESYINNDSVNLVAGHTLNAIDDVAIGAGRVMTASQAGPLITISASDSFVLEDEGRTIYWGDGGESVIRRYIDADNAEACVPATHAAQSMTMRNIVGSTYAFRRKWNDTIIDDGVTLDEIGLFERMLSARDLYIPQINFDPIPSCNIVKSDSGFTIFAERDGSDYWYSNIGAKPYIEGQYRSDHQFSKLSVSIRDIQIFPATAIILCPTKTFTIALNVPIPNVGNDDVGEFIQKLTEPSEADGQIGVIHYKTIAYVNAALFIALTNEPAIRVFDGHNWSTRNFAISSNGLPAVMNDINKIDSFYGLIGWYSHKGGYKLFAWKWSDS